MTGQEAELDSWLIETQLLTSSWSFVLPNANDFPCFSPSMMTFVSGPV
jgi:hypothetical protein